MFDIQLILDYASEQGLHAEKRTDALVAVDLGCGLILCFENLLSENDTMIYFQGSDGDWHSHGDLFLKEGDEIALVPLNVLQAILDGSLLVSRTEYPNGVVDIGLEYSSTKYDLALVGDGETLTFIKVPKKALQRAPTSSVGEL